MVLIHGSMLYCCVACDLGKGLADFAIRRYLYAHTSARTSFDEKSSHPSRQASTLCALGPLRLSTSKSEKISAAMFVWALRPDIPNCEISPIDLLSASRLAGRVETANATMVCQAVPGTVGRRRIAFRQQRDLHVAVFGPHLKGSRVITLETRSVIERLLG